MSTVRRKYHIVGVISISKEENKRPIKDQLPGLTSVLTVIYIPRKDNCEEYRQMKP